MRPTGLTSYDRKKKKARFECIVPGTNSRKRVRKMITVKSWNDLLAQLKTFRDSVQHPESVTAPDRVPTLSEYVDAAHESLSSRLSPAKRKNNSALLAHHILPVLGDLPLDQVTIAHLEDLVTLLQRKTHGNGRPYSGATINNCLHLVRRILKHAWRRRVITDYPLREQLPLLHEPVVQNELTTTERDAVLAAFDDAAGFRAHFTTKSRRRTGRKHAPPKPTTEFVTYAFERFAWSKPLFTLALYTGLRRSDLRLLTWRSVDLQSGVIRVIMRKTKRLVVLPIAPAAREAFEVCRARRIMSEYVLLTPEGRPYSESTISRYFVIAKAIAGITRRFRFHDQRHTFASILATRGINSFTLRDLLGHTSTRTTERYARPSDEALQMVKEALS